MLEREMDIWDAPLDAWIGITTNGTVRADGRLVMGRGVAHEARDKFHNLDLYLGSWVTEHGNVCVFCFKQQYGLPRSVFSFPVKHSWRQPADPELIRQSATQLDGYVRHNWRMTFYLPRPGCGNGRLRWQDVRPVIEFLPDNVVVVDRPRVPTPIPTLGTEMSNA